MTLNDLISTIQNSTDETIEVKRNKVYHGNLDGTGDYHIVTLRIGEKKYQFQNKNAEWEHVA